MQYNLLSWKKGGGGCYVCVHSPFKSVSTCRCVFGPRAISECHRSPLRPQLDANKTRKCQDRMEGGNASQESRQDQPECFNFNDDTD